MNHLQRAHTPPKEIPHPMTDKTEHIVVTVNQQQMVLLERLESEGEFGNSLADVVTNVFRRYVDDLQKKETGHDGPRQ